ncbi:MAG TPA: deoxynucleoside kinase [Bacteroidales bacterium]|jgi:deoxyadenosine/deoxycytidine kinase|nr:deoxynucleoside kinase [Bacteroidales bacterium]HNZ42825.1 deoxynucleoside kinase [Bacteroidales bacterium]HPB24988.1 deoxynucleoside kinase [Bacteroidales bacterium]HPI30240.1 deoxynucleoside kinase [Bacteroidales bacterium]HQN15648.1 deoxynucleoside kinase [Bacteroidales bacterium]
MYDFIAIEGNIGAGKTSLSTKIAQQFDARLILEQFEDNAFLPKFYRDPEKYAFPLELTFLASRYQQLKEQLTHKDLFQTFTISDYYIYKSLIFAKKTLQDDELALYTRLFNIINGTLPKPDLLVYLYVEVPRLKRNIITRGREYEQDIEHDYLERIQSGYFDFIKQQTDLRILILDVNKVDFVHCEADYEKILGIIMREYPVGIQRIEV